MNGVEAPQLLAICSNPFCVAGIDCPPPLPKRCGRCHWPLGKVPTAEQMLRLGKAAERRAA